MRPELIEGRGGAGAERTERAGVRLAARADVDLLLTKVAYRAPLGGLVDRMNIAHACAFRANHYISTAASTSWPDTASEKTLMAELLLGNVEESVPDEEINAFLHRYGFPPFDSIERVPVATGQPLALLRFSGLSPEGLRLLQSRIHNVFWKEHTISAQIFREREE
jgi:hypothetical protein